MSFETKKPLTCSDVLEIFGFITAVIVIISVMMLIGEALTGISAASIKRSEQEKKQKQEMIEVQKAYLEALTIKALSDALEKGQKDGL